LNAMRLFSDKQVTMHSRLAICEQLADRSKLEPHSGYRREAADTAMVSLGRANHFDDLHKMPRNRPAGRQTWTLARPLRKIFFRAPIRRRE